MWSSQNHIRVEMLICILYLYCLFKQENQLPKIILFPKCNSIKELTERLIVLKQISWFITCLLIKNIYLKNLPLPDQNETIAMNCCHEIAVQYQ